MSELQPCLDVAPDEWLAGARQLAESGYPWFGWLTALDAGDGALTLLCQVADVSTPGAMRTHTMRTHLPAGTPVASLTPVYAGAAWCERETAELFGLALTGFEDPSGLGLRPLLLPAGFPGAPLRKDYRQTGPDGQEAG